MSTRMDDLRLAGNRLAQAATGAFKIAGRSGVLVPHRPRYASLYTLLQILSASQLNLLAV